MILDWPICVEINWSRTFLDDKLIVVFPRKRNLTKLKDIIGYTDYQWQESDSSKISHIIIDRKINVSL